MLAVVLICCIPAVVIFLSVVCVSRHLQCSNGLNSQPRLEGIQFVLILYLTEKIGPRNGGSETEVDF